MKIFGLGSFFVVSAIRIVGCRLAVDVLVVVLAAALLSLLLLLLLLSSH